MAPSKASFIFGLFLTIAGVLCQQNYEVTYDIAEEIPAHIFGNVIQNTDIRSDYNEAQISEFTFSTLTNSDLDISIDELTGDLSTNSPIDRESLESCSRETHCVFNVDFSVISGSIVTLLVKTTISIVDENDVVPQFSQSIFPLIIPETAAIGRTWTLPVAIDNDSPAFGINEYRLQQNSPVFELVVRQVDGIFELSLALRSGLDRETQSEYSLVVEALDGQNVGEMTIAITIRDSNDNPPVFDVDAYEANIPENYPESLIIITVSATDNDIDENGQVVYSFDTNTQDAYGHLFAINDQTGAITVSGVVDYEVNDVYRLTVVAHDMGPDSQQATVRVTINILDENDRVPEVTVNAPGAAPGTARVIEGAPLETFVAQVIVSDADSGENGRVTCTLNDNVFQLQKASETEYTIQTAADLNREVTPVYNLAIMCEDHGEEPKRTLEQLTVYIDDINDNQPTFSREVYTVSIPENSGGGVFLTMVWATDEDLGENARLSYNLSSNVDSLLYITTMPTGGEIRTIRSFDRENTTRIEFTVIATDHGDPQLSGSVLIVLNIEDVNDERPQFTLEEYSIEFEEEQIEFLPLGEVHATDPDSFPSNVVTYSLEPQSRDIFEINPQSGELKSKYRLDRETKASYEIIAIATDNGSPPQSSSATILLDLIDINDNYPLFGFPSDDNNTVYISNNHRVGTLITTISATDADSGAYGTVTYSLEQTNPREFNLNSQNGHVTLSSDLSDVDFREYTLYVSASDQGSPQKTRSRTLHISVNKTLSSSSGDGSADKPNETAVIAVACVAGILIVVLGLGIMCIIFKRRQLRKQKESALKKGFVTIQPQQNHGYAQKQECIHPHHAPHDASFGPQTPSPRETDEILKKGVFNYHRSSSVQDSGIVNPSFARTNNASPLNEDQVDYERDTSSAEGSNADSGRGPSEEGESQSQTSFPNIPPTRMHKGAPAAQFTDTHLGFETPGRRVLYNKTGSQQSINQRQASPKPPPIPPHEPYKGRSSGQISKSHPHEQRQNYAQDNLDSRHAHIQRVDSHRSNEPPVKYLDGSCSKDVYV